jgi:carboxynorspermidine decarboxylase
MDRNETTDLLESLELATPAFVIDVKTLLGNLTTARHMVCDGQSRLLFALKAFSLVAGLDYIANHVDGFAASSLNEVRLARAVSFGNQTTHVTTPGLRPDEIVPLCELADYVSFNSISQWQRFRSVASGRVNCGLRINPQLSCVADPRYDPCRKNSKLGVPLDELRLLVQKDSQELRGINGIHFHTNCDSLDLAPLLSTVDHLLSEIGPLFGRIQWINLGGGYLFNQIAKTDALQVLKSKLSERGSFELFMEPGAAIVRNAGYIVSTVIDLLTSEGRWVAVLDTSTNHMPEVFEYQLRPDVVGDAPSGEHAYLLAGSTCLAGDVFGEYRFDAPLAVGARVIIPDRGAYSVVKSNMFNGINLPTVYVLSERGALEEVKHYGFEDFLSLCGASNVKEL